MLQDGVDFHTLTRTAPDHWLSIDAVDGPSLRKLDPTFDYLRTAATAAGVHNLGDVVTAANRRPSFLRAPRSIPTTAAVTETKPGSHLLHQRRNILAALCCTAALDADDPTGGLMNEVATLPPRTNLLPGRPLYGDERLLLRLLVGCLLLRGGKHLLAVAKYVLCEAGCMTGEATKVFIANLDDPWYPTSVNAPGTKRRSKRSLPLDAWQTHALGCVAAAQAESGNPEKPLAYHGDKHEPGSGQAEMSCHRSLILIMSRAGLWRGTEVTASSISVSAADRVERAQGPEAAIAILGRADKYPTLREARAARQLRRHGTTPTNVEQDSVTSFLPAPLPPYEPPSAAAQARSARSNRHPK